MHPVRSRLYLLSICVLIMALLSAAPATADSTGSSKGFRVVAAKERVEGRSYAQWSAEWWRWVLSTPAAEGPFTDTGTVDCDANQRFDDVLFLAGSFTGEPVERTCMDPVTRGTFVFFPLANVECSNLEPDPFFGKNAKERRACVKRFKFSNLEASINGTAVPSFRVMSPDFRFTAVEGNPGGVPAGNGRSTSRGVWLMLQLLKPGTYDLTFTGRITLKDPPIDFTSTARYRLTVG
jgi:hypothetical protein